MKYVMFVAAALLTTAIGVAIIWRVGFLKSIITGSAAA